MRGLVIAALVAIVTSSGCIQSQPPAPVVAPVSRAPASADAEQTGPADTAPTSAVASSDESPPAPREPLPVATTPTSPPATVSETPPLAEPPSAAVAPDAAAAVQIPAISTPPEETLAEGPVAVPASPPRDDASAEVAAVPPPDEVPLPEPAPVAPPTPAQAPAALALDLAGLEQRLRDTRAIGVFTKLSLKNQVDDLLGQFRAFYRGQLKVQLTELRQRYELLLFKVLTLLQDADRDLAEAIAASREAIWGILSDPQKLAQI